LTNEVRDGETWNRPTESGAPAKPEAHTQAHSAGGSLLDPLGYFRSLAVTIPLVYLSTIFWGSLSLLVSLFDKTGHGQHWCSRWWARTLLFVSRARVRVRGLENVPPESTCIFAANHQSYMDIPVLFGYLPGQFRIMAKSSLFKLPFLGWHLTTSGHMPIERDNPRRAARSLLEAARHIKSGTRVFIFPEGGRTIDGRLAEFKAGTFLLAIKAGVPVIPVTVNGTRGILKINSWHIRPGHVEMILHPPIPTAGMHTDSAEELCAHVKQVIASAYDEARAVAAK
jgi:1-acyl-sn-glycerol-3-phosphate acyltransferase